MEGLRGSSPICILGAKRCSHLGEMAAPTTVLDSTRPRICPQTGKGAEVIPVIIMRCSGMKLRNREMEAECFLAQIVVSGAHS